MLAVVTEGARNSKDWAMRPYVPRSCMGSGRADRPGSGSRRGSCRPAWPGAGRAGRHRRCRAPRSGAGAASVPLPLVVVAAAGGDHRPDHRHRQPDDRAAPHEVAAGDLACAYDSTRSRCTGTDLAANPIETLPIHGFLPRGSCAQWAPPPAGTIVGRTPPPRSSRNGVYCQSLRDASAPPGSPPVRRRTGPNRSSRPLSPAIRTRCGRRARRGPADEAVVRIAVTAAATMSDAGCDVRAPRGAGRHEPTAASVDDLAELVSGSPRPVVVGVGGGIALDSAKQAAAVAVRPPASSTTRSVPAPCRSGPPVVAIPTTAGTGSEVTRTCVVTTPPGARCGRGATSCCPPRAARPGGDRHDAADVTAATGLDAFVHAVEAASGRRTSSAVDAAGPAGDPARPRPPAGARSPTGRPRRAPGDAGGGAARRVAIDAGGTGIAHAIGHALGTSARRPRPPRRGGRGRPRRRARLERRRRARRARRRGDGVRPAGGRAGRGLPRAARGHRVARRRGPGRAPRRRRGRPGGRAPGARERPMHDNNCRRPDEPDRRHLARSTLRTWADLLTTSTSER